MAVNGTELDVHVNMWKDGFLQESQQVGSRLEQVAVHEMMSGETVYIKKTGKAGSTTKTTLEQSRIYNTATYELRQLSATAVESAEVFDKESLFRMATNPKSARMQAIVSEMARKTDAVIMAAISGTATVTQNGSAANTALSLSVAVDDGTIYGDSAGDKGLTAAKLKVGTRLISESYGSTVDQGLICIAPMRQLMLLSTEAQTVSGDFRVGRPLDGPGLIRGLSGYLGIDFIAYEDTGVDGNDDDKVFLLTKDAITLGTWIPLTVRSYIDDRLQLSPEAIAVYKAIGAVRTHEEKVAVIACDPLAL